MEWREAEEIEMKKRGRENIPTKNPTFEKTLERPISQRAHL